MLFVGGKICRGQKEGRRANMLDRRFQIQTAVNRVE